MTRTEKAQIIDELSEKFSNNNFFYFADASGLTVAQINQFRSLCFGKGIEYRVIKNTLIKKALEKAKIDSTQLEEGGVLKGFSGVMFANEAPANAPARIIKEYQKKAGKPLLKGAYIDSDIYIGDENVKTLSDLKSKEELVGEIIGLLQSPAKNVISALESSKHKLSGIVKTLSEREEK